jgi:hypothetical protein
VGEENAGVSIVTDHDVLHDECQSWVHYFSIECFLFFIVHGLYFTIITMQSSILKNNKMFEVMHFSVTPVKG